jgi:hypothetical protein
LLGVVRLGFRRCGHTVTDQIIVEARAAGARIAEPVDLDRGKAVGEQLGPVVPGIAFEIDRNVEPIAPCLRDDRGIVHLVDIDEAFDIAD